MDDLDCLRKIETIKSQLTSCQDEVSALAREALSSTTSETRRVEALIRRAALQTRVLALMRDLDSLQLAACGESRGRELEREQNNPWPQFSRRREA